MIDVRPAEVSASRLLHVSGERTEALPDFQSKAPITNAPELYS